MKEFEGGEAKIEYGEGEIEGVEGEIEEVDDDDDDDHHHDNDSDLNVIHENKTPIKESVPSIVSFSEPYSEQISVPSTSTSKATHMHWPQEVKDGIRKELSDCINWP